MEPAYSSGGSKSLRRQTITIAIFICAGVVAASAIFLHPGEHAPLVGSQPLTTPPVPTGSGQPEIPNQTRLPPAVDVLLTKLEWSEFDWTTITEYLRSQPDPALEDRVESARREHALRESRKSYEVLSRGGTRELNRLEDSEVISLLNAVLRGTSGQRGRASVALSNAVRNQDTIDKLVALYNQSQDPAFRADILTALNHSNAPALPDILLSSLRSDSRDERIVALSVLAQCADIAMSRLQEFLEALQPFRQTDTTSSVSRDLYKAIGAFARSHDPAALELLKRDALEVRSSDSQLYALKQIPSADQGLPWILTELRNSESVRIQEEVLFRASTLVATGKNSTALSVVAGFLSPQTDPRLQELALEKLDGFVPFLPLWGEKSSDAKALIQQSVHAYLSTNPPIENLEKSQKILTQLSQCR